MPKAVVIGWHGADWKSLHPLIDAGLMPNLRSLVERGVAGNLKSGVPNIPELLWTTLATGKSPEQHGILSALEYDPVSGGARHAGNSSRRVKALWNIAMQNGLRTHVAGWHAAHPAEPLNGSSTTHDFVRPLAQFGEPWPVLPGSIHPDRLRKKLEELRVHAGELTGADLAPFIPKLAEIDQEKDGRVLQLADIMAKAIGMHAVVTWLLQNEPWDVMMIGWNALERACRLFMRYTSPQMPGVAAEDCERYGDVVEGMYCFLDLFLGPIMRLAGPEATIAVVSPAGFRSGAERPAPRDSQPRDFEASGAAWYRPYGIFAMAGPGIARDGLVHGATVLDFAPMVLAALGLPAAEDMPGKIPDGVFENRVIPRRVASWEEIAGECGMIARESEAERQAAAAALEQLKRAGYAEPQDGAKAAIERDRLLNTALLHLAAGRYGDARGVFARLAEEAPRDGRICLWLAHCHIVCGDAAASRKVLREVSREGVFGPLALLIEAHIELATGNAAKAVALVTEAESRGGELPIVNYAAGLMYARAGQSAEAERSLIRATELDPALQPAYTSLAGLLSDRGRDAAAAEIALRALELDYSSAVAHLALGMAMLGAGTDEQARAAFERSLAFDPQLRQAREWGDALRPPS